MYDSGRRGTGRVRAEYQAGCSSPSTGTSARSRAANGAGAAATARYHIWSADGAAQLAAPG